MKHALVVDDDDSMLEFCAVVLTLNGYAVTRASSGARAQTLMESFAFDLVLTDHVRAPEGRSMTALAKAIWPGTDVIVMTASPSEEDARVAALEGACGYLAKPFKLSDLLRAIGDCR